VRGARQAGKTKEKYISPLVQELSGIVQIPDDFNIKEAYTDYLFNKYKINES
jgi:hypothetical protein